MGSCFVLIGTHQHCVAKMPCVPQRIGPCSQTVSNLDPKFYTETLATRIQECILFYLADNTTYEHMHPTLRKERDYSQSLGPKMNVLEMGLIKVYKSKQKWSCDEKHSLFRFLYLPSTNKCCVERIKKTSYLDDFSYHIMSYHALLKAQEVNLCSLLLAG